MDEVKYAVTPADEAAIEMAAQLLIAADVASRATIIAGAITSLLPDSACLVHRYQPENESAPWTIVGIAGECRSTRCSTRGTGCLRCRSRFRRRRRYMTSTHLSREDYAHFNASRSVGALAYCLWSTTGN